MTMLPFFNKLPYTNFHELNIDWLCTAYQHFIEQLQDFDVRLTEVQESTDARISAMEQELDTFETSITGEINDFKADVNQRFADLSDDIAAQFSALEDSFDNRFTQLQNALEQDISDLRTEVENEFETLSGNIESRFTELESEINDTLAAFNTRITAIESSITDLEIADNNIKAEVISSGMFNYYPTHDSFAYAPAGTPEAEHLTANEDYGTLTISGYVEEDYELVLGGSPNSYPFGFSDLPYDMTFTYSVDVIWQDGALFQPAEFFLKIYEDGDVVRTITALRGGGFTLTKAEVEAADGIELGVSFLQGVNYGMIYKPLLLGVPSSSGEINMSYKEVKNNLRIAQGQLYADHHNDEIMNSRNVWYRSSLDTYTSGVVDDVSFSQNYEGIAISGTTDHEIEFLFDSGKSFFDLSGYLALFPAYIWSDNVDTDIKVKLVGTVLQDEIIVDYGSYDLIEIQDELYNCYLIVGPGTYHIRVLPYASEFMSNRMLEYYDDDIDNRLEEVEAQTIGERTFEGNPVTFEDPIGNVPLKEVIVDFKPTQDLHGYDYPWPAGGNKNIINAPDIVASAGDTIYSDNVGLAAGTYTLSSSNTTSDIAIVGVGSGPMPYTFTLAADTTSLTIEAITSGTFNDIQLEVGSTATSYVPYANECPISGVSSITITPNSEIPVIIAFGNTYYAGSLNVTIGVLKVTHKNLALDNLTWDNYGTSRFMFLLTGSDRALGINSTSVCSSYRPDIGNRTDINMQESSFAIKSTYCVFKNSKYSSVSDFKNSLSGQYLCYELLTPIEVQLSAEEIYTLFGNNVITSSVGSLKVTIKSFIESFVEKYTERYIITYASGNIDRTFSEILEAYAEGRRLVFRDNSTGLCTELNQYDDTNNVFHWEYNTFGTGTITFTEIVIDINGINIDTRTVSAS